MPKPKISNFGINLNINGLSEGKLDYLIDKLIELRVEWIRLDFDLDAQFSEVTYDYFLKRCFDNNIKILALLNRGVPGTVINILYPERNYPPVLKIKDTFLKFVEDIVRKYSKYIHDWEIWNEPNYRRFWSGGPDPKEYNILLIETVKIIKKIDNDAKILFGGIMSSDLKKQVYGHRTNFFTDYVKDFGDNTFDFVSFHPYIFDCYFSIKSIEQYKKALLQDYNDLVASVKDVTNKPIWFTEFGISPRWVRLSQMDIAKLYAWYFNLCAKNKIKFFIWQLYDLNNLGYEKLTPEKYFGLLDFEFKPKPVYDFLIKEMENL